MSWLQLPIPGGRFLLQLSVSMIQVTSQYDGPLPDSAVFVIKNISIIPGSDCSDIAISKLDVTHIRHYDMSRLVGKQTMWFPHRSETNRSVQS